MQAKPKNSIQRACEVTHHHPIRKTFADLPEQVQEQTREAYRQFKQDPGHPSLRFKKVHPELPIYSARISKNYRAVGQLDGDTVIWFWVGSHAEYGKLLSQL